MRVTCDKCGAAYAVDEKRIPDKGARAQCPKCKAVQVVKRPVDVAAAPEPVKPAASNAPLADPLSSIFGAGPAAQAPAASAPGFAAAPSGGADPFGGFGAAGTPTSPAPDPFGFSPAPAAAGSADPFGGFGSPPGGGAKADPFGGFSSAPAPAAASGNPFGGFGAGPAPAAPKADPFGGFGPAPAAGAAKADPFGGFAAAPAAGSSASDPFGGFAPSTGAAADPLAGFGAGFAAAPAPAAANPFGGSPGFAAPPSTGLPPDPFAAAARAQASKPAAEPEADPFGDIPGFAAAPAGKAPAAEAAGAAKVPVVVFGGAASAPKPAAKPAAAEADFLAAPAADLDAFGGAGAFDFSNSSAGPAPEPNPAASKAPAKAPASSGLELDFGEEKEAAPVAPKRTAPPVDAPTVPAPSAARASVPGTPLPAPKIARRARRGGLGGVVAVIMVLLVAGGGAYLAVSRPTWLSKPKEQVKKSDLLPEIEKRLLTWRMALPGLQGTAEEHIKKGVEYFHEDRTTAYVGAQEEFKAAIVLDPKNYEAVARYVEAIAVGNSDRVEADRLAETRELLGAVLRERPTMALAKRAKANLLLATGQEELARAEAEEAYKLSAKEEQPEALLAWGRTYLKKSAPIAQEKFEGALQMDPSLKRAIFYRGLAAEYAGQYPKAIAAYTERLEKDADQRDALRALARVQAKVGNLQAARKALEMYEAKYPYVGEPRVMNAQLAYALDRDLREADRLLGLIENDLGKYDDTDKLQFHTLASAVARERGNLELAVTHARSALAIDADWGPAHFQAMLAALASSDAVAARRHLDACEQKLGDPGRFQTYVGRIEVVAGQLDGAIAAFRKAAELAPTRVAPKLAAAALLVRRGDENGAWAVLRRMLELDPTSIARQRRSLSEYFEPEIGTIEVAAGAFETDSDSSEEKKWLRDVFSAIVDYHLGELDGPARTLDESLVLDQTSVPALIYRSQIELDRKRFDKALAFARRAVQADRQNPVGNLLVGRALEGLKKIEPARMAYVAALQQNPRFGAANIRLAELAERSGNRTDARERLMIVVSDDPENLDAQVALFRTGE